MASYFILSRMHFPSAQTIQEVFNGAIYTERYFSPRWGLNLAVAVATFEKNAPQKHRELFK